MLGVDPEMLWIVRKDILLMPTREIKVSVCTYACIQSHRTSCLPFEVFLPAWESAFVFFLLSFHTSGFCLTRGSEDPKWLNKSRVYRIADQQQQTAKVTLASDYCICSPHGPSVRATPSSICSLSLHQPDSLSWQDQEERECGPVTALTHGNL